MWATEASDNEALLHINSFCLMHQAHLIIKSELAMVDKFLKLTLSRSRLWGYFATLTKSAQLWRDHNKLIFKTWLITFGAESAMLNAKRIPGRPAPQSPAGMLSECDDDDDELKH